MGLLLPLSLVGCTGGRLAPVTADNMVAEIQFQFFVNLGLYGHGVAVSAGLVVAICAAAVWIALFHFEKPTRETVLMTRLGAFGLSLPFSWASYKLCSYIFWSMRHGVINCFLCGKRKFDVLIYEPLSAPSYWSSLIVISVVAACFIAFTLRLFHVFYFKSMQRD